MFIKSIFRYYSYLFLKFTLLVPIVYLVSAEQWHSLICFMNPLYTRFAGYEAHPTTIPNPHNIKRRWGAGGGGGVVAGELWSGIFSGGWASSKFFWGGYPSGRLSFRKACILFGKDRLVIITKNDKYLKSKLLLTFWNRALF